MPPLPPDNPSPSVAIEVAPPARLCSAWRDLVAHTPRRGNRSAARYGLLLTITALLSSGFHMVLAYRLAATCHRWRLLPLCILLEKFIFHWYHCIIPSSAQIGPGLWVPHPLGIVLNSRSRLGANVILRQYVEIVHIWDNDVGVGGVVGDRAQLNSGAILLRGASVGHDSIVAARAVVTKPVPARHVAMGTPAKTRPLEDRDQRDMTPKWRSTT